jgi:hypothetical protein
MGSNACLLLYFFEIGLTTNIWAPWENIDMKGFKGKCWIRIPLLSYVNTMEAFNLPKSQPDVSIEWFRGIINMIV